MTRKISSNVRHLEEITEAGLELPSVNQIEVQYEYCCVRVIMGLICLVSCQLHPFCQQKTIVDYCRSHGIVIQAYTPLIKGQFQNPVLQELSKKVS